MTRILVFVTCLIGGSLVAASQQPPPQPGIAGESDRATALLLLDRVETALTRAVGDKVEKSDIVGTSGSDAGSMKVTMDRGEIDQIRAEIAQIKLLLGSTPRDGRAPR